MFNSFEEKNKRFLDLTTSILRELFMNNIILYDINYVISKFSNESLEFIFNYGITLLIY